MRRLYELFPPKATNALTEKSVKAFCFDLN